MQKILILGIGRSTYYLLKYLNDHIASDNVMVTALGVQVAIDYRYKIYIFNTIDNN